MRRHSTITLACLLALTLPSRAGGGPPGLYGWSFIGVFAAIFLAVTVVTLRWLRRHNLHLALTLLLAGALGCIVKTALEIHAEYYLLGAPGFAFINLVFFVIYACLVIFPAGLFLLFQDRKRRRPIQIG